MLGEKELKELQEEEEVHSMERVYNVNIFRVLATISNKDDDIIAKIVLNGFVCSVLDDTGAEISVCGSANVCEWKHLDRMLDTKMKIKPYGRDTPLIYPKGVCECALTFRSRSIPVDSLTNISVFPQHRKAC